MVLAHTEDVEPDLVGELDLLHEVAQPPLGRLALSDVSEREDTDLHDEVLPTGAWVSRAGALRG